MASVEMIAKAKIRNGIMEQENFREAVLQAFGTSDQTLLNLYNVFTKGIITQAARLVTIDRKDYFARLDYNAATETVTITVIADDASTVLGTGVYGKTKFFSPVVSPDDQDENGDY